MPVSVDLFGKAVAGGHFFNSLANMFVDRLKMTKNNRQQPFAKRLASGHPLEIVPSPMMVRTVERRAGDHHKQPSKELLMSHVHSQGYLRLPPVAAEMAFANQNAEEEAFVVVGHDLPSLQ